MKRNLIFLFLLTVFCVTPVLAQLQESDLRTEFIRLNKFDLKQDKNDSKDLSEQSKLLSKIVNSLLSKRGVVDFDSRNSTIIITDIKSRSNFAVELVRVLENSELTQEKFFKPVDKKEELVTETVKTQNMFPIVGCYGYAHSGKNFDPPLWANTQSFMLIKINSQLKLVNWTSEIKREIEITGTRERVKLFKDLITLFDQPFLAEEFENR